MFERILRELVGGVPGAIGAIILDHEGESVQFFSERVFEIGPDGLRAIGAYQGIFLAELRRLCERTGAGQPQRFTTEFAHSRVHTSDLKDGYYVVLIAEPAANDGIAWHHLRSCRQRLLAEL